MQQLENYVEVAKKASINIQGIKTDFIVVYNKLRNLTFEKKRFALESLSIRVWVDGENVK